ncbi:MAG: GNAT family N-acetyltransferase [Roseovarius sp.]|nr:GNAT family N-acetyltransferase [Roseovarius sp.]
MTPAFEQLLAAAEATWPPAATETLGPVTLRDGAGGGKRVSAATATRPVTAEELARAEEAMRARGGAPLFQLPAGQEAFDRMLADRGYGIVDPVDVLVAPVATLVQARPPRLRTFAIWEPLEIMREIWAEGGVGPERLAVMARVRGPKTALFARHADQPGGVGFAAVAEDIGMVHALAVRPEHRRAGVGRLMMVQAALWAEAQGARHLAVLCTRANASARGFYDALGFRPAGCYHYRQKE